MKKKYVLLSLIGIVSGVIITSIFWYNCLLKIFPKRSKVKKTIIIVSNSIYKVNLSLSNYKSFLIKPLILQTLKGNYNEKYLKIFKNGDIYWPSIQPLSKENNFFVVIKYKKTGMGILEVCKDKVRVKKFSFIPTIKSFIATKLSRNEKKLACLIKQKRKIYLLVFKLKNLTKEKMFLIEENTENYPTFPVFEWFPDDKAILVSNSKKFLIEINLKNGKRKILGKGTEASISSNGKFLFILPSFGSNKIEVLDILNNGKKELRLNFLREIENIKCDPEKEENFCCTGVLNFPFWLVKVLCYVKIEDLKKGILNLEHIIKFRLKELGGKNYIYFVKWPSNY